MKTLVLDIGGIFFHPSWRLEGIAHVSQILGVPKEDLKEALNRNKHSFYTGKMSEKDYWRNIIQDLNVSEFTSDYLEEIYRSYVRPIPETLMLLPELASRYRLVACNNCPKEWMEYRKQIASLDTFFSEFFTSGYIGSMKPEEDMYSKIFADGRVDKGDIIYIDDNEDYASLVRERYGVKSVVYKGPSDLLFWIR
ncbi:MAG: HAD hydrolase-like protein [Candidatus Paceibacterota bacterium]|jgi:FMN phosphatase YigB (HAD superfamily)